MKMAEAPIFSIVIPTYNRPTQLAACLQACARLDYPPDCFEVIVVDDGGITLLDEVVARFDGVLKLKLLRQGNAGPAAARNRGASEAGGEFLAFTDDDCSPDPKWLRALAEQFVASPDCAVGGQTLNALTHNLYSTASQHLISYLFSYYNAVPHAARFFPSNNLAFPTRQFRGIGGAVVYHAHDLTFRTFLGQHFRYGRGAFCFHQIRARRGQHRFKVEPLAFYFNMLRYPFVNAKGVNALILMLLLVVTQVVNTAGFLWERTSGKRGMTTQRTSPS